MEKKDRPSFPKNFFSTPRPKVSTKEVLQDVIPINWAKKEKNEKKKIIAYSSKEKKML